MLHYIVTTDKNDIITPMRLLVTGGAGFIGSNFIHHWVRNYPDNTIVNLDKLTYAGNLMNLKSIEKHPTYTFVRGDICDRATVDLLMKDTDVVVHFAAETHVDNSIADAAPFLRTNVFGTYTLLESARKYQVQRFHHISTDEVYGALELDTQEKFTEHTPYDPHSPYSASKASSDHLVRAYYHTYNVPITISNCSNNVGPYQFPEKFIPLMITNLIRGKKIPIYGDGKYTRDWLHAEDHCEAIDLIIKKGTVGETYNVGGSMTEQHNNLSVAKKVLEIMEKDENMIEYVTDRPGHDRRYDVDWSKINKELGWSPKHTFDTTIEETVQWYIDNEDWWQPLIK